MRNNSSLIGDLLITFSPPENELPSRSISPWLPITRHASAQVQITSSDPQWYGFPLSTYQDDRWQIWALGEFYGASQPDLVHALETSADLNGHFLIFGYEKAADRWHVLSDRFGTVHGYYAQVGPRAAIGTFSPAVAAAVSAKTLDWGAIGGFFQFGFFLGNSTYWHAVHLFKPATHTIFNGDGHLLSQHRTWTWYHQPDPHFDRQAATETFADLFHQVIAEQVRDKTVAVPISGGLDSRSTLIPLTDQDLCQPKQLFYFSYGYGPDSVETSIAKQLAKKRAFNLTTWAIQPYLFGNITRALAAGEGFQDITLTRQVDVVDQLGEQASHVLAAHWMDVWLDDMGFIGVSDPLSDDALATKMVTKFTKNGSQLLVPLFAEWFPSNFEEQIASHITHQLGGQHAIQDLDFKVKAWKTWNWSFRWTLPSLRAYQLGLFTLLPFYDQRLADFFCQQPSWPMQKRAFQIEYLKRYGPDLARVTWEVYDANLYNYQNFNTWLLPKRAVKKLIRALHRKQVFIRNWEVQFLNPKGKTELENWLLTPGLKLHNYLGKQRLTALLNDFHAAPNAANGYAVSMLLTFSTWLENYG